MRERTNIVNEILRAASAQQGETRIKHDSIERVRNEWGPEAAEIAKDTLKRRADNQVRALARKVGLRARCKRGHYTILRALSDATRALASRERSWLELFWYVC